MIFLDILRALRYLADKSFFSPKKRGAAMTSKRPVFPLLNRLREILALDAAAAADEQPQPKQEPVQPAQAGQEQPPDAE